MLFLPSWLSVLIFIVTFSRTLVLLYPLNVIQTQSYRLIRFLFSKFFIWVVITTSYPLSYFLHCTVRSVYYPYVFLFLYAAMSTIADEPA